MNNRKSDLKIYGGRYKIMWARDLDDTYNCFYCGGVKQCKDHFPPISYAYMFDSSQDHVLVNSCSECNSLLSDSVQYNIMDRKRFVQKKLRNKYLKQINSLWTDDELIDWKKKNGKSVLLKSVKAYKREKDNIINRINYPGYEYDIDGSKSDWTQHCLQIKVFGITYKTVDHAIEDICSGYKLPIEIFRDRCDNGESIEIVADDLRSKKYFECEIYRISEKFNIKVKSAKAKFKRVRNKVNFMSDIEALLYMERQLSNKNK